MSFRLPSYNLGCCLYVQVEWYSTKADSSKGVIVIRIPLQVEQVCSDKLYMSANWNNNLRCSYFLQGERKYSTLSGISFVFALHVIFVYWWYWTDLSSSLVMIPPKAVPPFWHAIFIIMVNGKFLLLYISQFNFGFVIILQ